MSALLVGMIAAFVVDKTSTIKNSFVPCLAHFYLPFLHAACPAPRDGEGAESGKVEGERIKADISKRGTTDSAGVFWFVEVMTFFQGKAGFVVRGFEVEAKRL